MAINEVGRPSNIVENRLSAQRDLNVPMSCDKCGSNYFEEVKLYQYSELSYGSTPYKLLTNQAKPMLKCICGYPVIPQARHIAGAAAVRQAAEDFNASAIAARKYIDKNTPEAFVKQAASPGELKAAVQSLTVAISEAVIKSSKDTEDKFNATIESIKANLPTPKKTK